MGGEGVECKHMCSLYVREVCVACTLTGKNSCKNIGWCLLDDL